jgi:methylmalonyl-CoA mutase
LKEEAHLLQQQDPTQGSYWVEENTSRLLAEGYDFMQQIESRGSMPGVLLQGWLRQQIIDNYSEHSQKFATRREAITGVSEFPELNEEMPQTESVFGDAEQDFYLSFKELVESCELNKNSSFENCIAASQSGASVFQISDALQSGMVAQSPQMVPLDVRRHAEQFEALRHQASTLANSSVKLFCLGDLAEHNARKSFATNFFAAGGLDVSESSNSPVICICGNDRQYEVELESTIQSLSKDHILVLVAGQFEDSISTLQKIHEVLA